MDDNASSLQAFQQALLNPLTALWNQIVVLLPNLLAALLLIIAGYAFGKFLAFLAAKLFARMGLDRLGQSTGLEQAAADSGFRVTLSVTLSQLIFWVVMLTFLISAANAMGLPRLSETINQIVLYLPKVIGAIVVGLIGLFSAHAVRKAVRAAGNRAGLAYAKPLSAFLYAVLLIVTLSLAFGQLELEVALLNQLLGIAALTMGISVALSLGLGTRDIARDIIAGHYARELHQPGSRVSFKDISGEIIAVSTTKTLVKTDASTLVSVSNRTLLDETVVTTVA